MKQILYVPNLLALPPEKLSTFPLSPQRQARCDQLYDEMEKKRFRGAEWISHQLISQYIGSTDVQICGMIAQRPYVNHHPGICFSRSYCGNGLVVAVDHGERIGVDCEVMQPTDEAVMKHFFTKGERAFVQRSSHQEFAFTLVWTRKESYVKCVGAGLHFPWNLLDMTPSRYDAAHAPICAENDPVGGFYLNSYLIDNMVLSICSSNNDSFPSVIQKWSEYEENNH